MSRPDGLTQLRAAVRDARARELARGARAVLVAADPLDGIARPRFRVVEGPGVTTAGLAVPSPSPAGDEALPAPEGDTAVAFALVQRAQAGDADAFGELYDRYVDLVYRYVYYRVASQQLAEDLTSETFLRALRRIGSFTWQGRDVGAWFVTIARNLIADHYKSGRYRLELTTDDVTRVRRRPRRGRARGRRARVDAEQGPAQRGAAARAPSSRSASCCASCRGSRWPRPRWPWARTRGR